MPLLLEYLAFSSKEYIAPDRARLELTCSIVQNPMRASLSKIIEHKVLLYGQNKNHVASQNIFTNGVYSRSILTSN